MGETWARDTDWQRTQYDQRYGMPRRDNSLPTQLTSCFNPDYHPARRGGTLSSCFVHSMDETQARDTDWRRTQYDRCYGLLQPDNSLPTQPTSRFDPDYHPSRRQGFCQAALSTVSTVWAKLGLEIWTGDGLSKTDIMGCSDVTIASQCNRLLIGTQIIIL